MTRIVLSLLMVFTATVNAAGKDSARQSRAILATLRSLTPTLDVKDMRRFIESEEESFSTLSKERRRELLDSTAVAVAKATDEVVHLLRDNEVESARNTLSNLSRLLVRAARISTATSRETYENVSRWMFFSYGVSLPVTTIGGIVSGVYYESFPVAATGLVATFVSLMALSPVVSEFSDDPWRIPMPFKTTLSRALGKNDDVAYFWQKVAEQLPDATSLESLKSLIQPELRGISFEQACESALLAAGAEKTKSTN